MNFVISCDDTRYEAFLERVPAEVTDIVRVNITPETMGEEIPWWFSGSPSRWAVKCAVVRALTLALEAGEDCHLYEDDCIFDANFSDKYTNFVSHLPADWDMAYLGGQILTRGIYPVMEVPDNEYVLRTRCAHRNHAWITKYASIQRLIDWINMPIWPNNHTTDWRICQLHLDDSFHVYIPKSDWMCGQQGGLSCLDGVVYPDRWWWIDNTRAAEETTFLHNFAEERRREEEEEKARVAAAAREAEILALREATRARIEAERAAAEAATEEAVDVEEELSSAPEGVISEVENTDIPSEEE